MVVAQPDVDWTIENIEDLQKAKDNRFGLQG